VKRLSLILLLIVFVTAMPTAWAEQTILTTTVPSQHTLTVSFGEGGTVKVNGTTLTEGTSIAIGRHEQVVIEIVPDSGNSTDTVSISSDYGVSQQGDCIEIARMVQDVAVQVNFLSVTERYAVTVENGSGSGEYAVGELVSIAANTPVEGEQFSGWTGSDGVAFADDSAAETTFIMPAKDNV